MFFSNLVLAQTPAAYQDKATIVGAWLLRSTAHQPFLSATPLGMRQDSASHSSSESFKEFRYGSDLSLSSEQSLSSQEVREAYNFFELGTPAPDELNMFRLHYGKTLGNRMDLGASYIFVPSIVIKGWGAHLSLNVIRYKNIFTTLRLLYSNVRKNSYFKTHSFALDLSQSVNFKFIDIYGGVKYFTGSILFISNSRGGAIPSIDYSSSSNNFEKYLGVSKFIYKDKVRANMQLNISQKEYALMAKISFKLPSATLKDGEWRWPQIF